MVGPDVDPVEGGLDTAVPEEFTQEGSLKG